MPLFAKLLFAHLVADYVLQFDELYRLKRRHISGYLIHILILISVIAVMALPYLKYPLMHVYILFIAATHLGQDLLKSKLQAKWPRRAFLFYMMDQAVHILILGGAVLLPFASQRPPLDNTWPLLSALYTDDSIIHYGTAFILITFVGTYTLYNFRRNYLANTREDHYLTKFEMIHSMIERSVVGGIILFSGSWLLVAASPVVGLLRLASPKLKNITDFALSLIWAAGFALLLR